MVLFGIWRRRRKLCQRSKSFRGFVLTSRGFSTDSCEPFTRRPACSPCPQNISSPMAGTYLESSLTSALLFIHNIPVKPLGSALDAPVICMVAERRCACRALI